MMADHLIVERDTGWLTLWMNRPDVRNALSADMMAAMRAALERELADIRRSMAEIEAALAPEDEEGSA